jgi:parallel beta-helix repeat protein
MKAARTPRVLWGIPLVLITAVFCPLAQGKVIRVDDDAPADFRRIQAGIDAADYGDTVLVAPGTYFENVTLRDGISLIGSGAEVTIIDANGYGDVVDARANDAAIAGFTLTNSGESDLAHMNCGVYVEGSYAPVVRSNVIVANRIGIGAWDGAHPDVRNNVIENNSDGLYLYGSKESPTDPQIINNTIVGNQIDGIVLRERVSPIITNNIIVGHATGINWNYVTETPILRYNNLWDNDVNYLHDGRADDTLAGPGSMSVDPCFAKGGYWVDVIDPNVAVVGHNGQNAVWMAGDYHLKSQVGRYDLYRQTWVRDDVTSPCIDGGDPNSPVAFEPFPNGGTINMGAYGGTAHASKSLSRRHAKYGGGKGEPNNPYLIYTAEQMSTIGTEPNDWSKHFKVMADIDLSAFDGKDGRPAFNIIAPDIDPVRILFQGTLFTGLFDGHGRRISHLTVKGGESLGLFGRLGSGARVKNLGIVDVNVIGSGDEVGALAGYSEGNVANCYSTGVVKGRYNVGGLVGYGEYGAVTQSHSAAAVNGRENVGGLLGCVRQRAVVADCHSAGGAAGTDVVGGLVGLNEGAVTRCHSTGAVRATGKSIGGLVGGGGGAAIQCFWDTQTSGQAVSSGGTGRTTAQMQTAQTFLQAGWDFVGESANGTEDIWWILEGKDYPRLWWEQGDEASK